MNNTPGVDENTDQKKPVTMVMMMIVTTMMMMVVVVTMLLLLLMTIMTMVMTMYSARNIHLKAMLIAYIILGQSWCLINIDQETKVDNK